MEERGEFVSVRIGKGLKMKEGMEFSFSTFEETRVRSRRFAGDDWLRGSGRPRRLLGLRRAAILALTRMGEQ